MHVFSKHLAGRSGSELACCAGKATSAGRLLLGILPCALGFIRRIWHPTKKRGLWPVPTTPNEAETAFLCELEVYK